MTQAQSPAADDLAECGGQPEADSGATPTIAEATPAEPAPLAAAARGWRRVLAWTVTGLAGVLVLLAMVVPSEAGAFTPAAFVRIPLEGLLGVALLLALPGKARRMVAVAAGVVLGVLAIVKIADFGFFVALARPFNPLFDWPFLEAAVELVAESYGRAAAVGAVIAAAVISVAVLVVMIGSMLRLTRVVVRHRTWATRAVAVLAVAWAALALLGTQIVPGVPLAAHNYGRLDQVYDSLRDSEEFAAASAVDAFASTASEELLTALRGKDVMVVFIESYGRDAIEHPDIAPQVSAVLDAGDERLRAAGFDSRSGFLTSPTAGGGSWLAHATLLSGVWVDNQQRYDSLVSSERVTLNRAFQRAGWRTVAAMPGIFKAWPEGQFFGYDEVYDHERLGYRGPRLNWGRIPDQYTLAAFQRFERARPDHPPVMAEIALLSSHAPWNPVPPLIDWGTVGNGSIYDAMAIPELDDSAEDVLSDPPRARLAYGQAIGYSLNTLISYVERYGDDDLVLLFLGDHQPAPVVTGQGASRDVPITIVARDPAVLDQISGWGWEAGLKPSPQAPVWSMDSFRDRFLTAFGPQSGSPAATAP